MGPGSAVELRESGLLQVEDALHKKLASAAGPRAAARGESLRAPIAGKVVKVLVAVGDQVAPGSPVIVLEAMKMENELISERGALLDARATGSYSSRVMEQAQGILDLEESRLAQLDGGAGTH